MKHYAVIVNGKISDHRLIYTRKDTAELELEALQGLPHWSARLKGATVAEVRVEIVTKLVDTPAEYKV